jgi:hypothetical protein
MQFERVTYHKTFNLGNYQSEKIGVDIVLTEEDTPEDAMEQAKDFVEATFASSNPQVGNPHTYSKNKK